MAQKRHYETKLAHFLKDEKHTLYREYLEIVALHQPAVFVMENVKGILSSRLPSPVAGSPQQLEYVFDKILADLRNPWQALNTGRFPDGWRSFEKSRKARYRVHSFVSPGQLFSGECDRNEYLIRCEHYGVPQERHRVIVLGVRDDIDIIPSTLTPSSMLPKATVRQVIGDLPRLRSGRSGWRTNQKRADDTTDSSASWLEAIRSAVSNKLLKSIPDKNVRELMKSVRERASTSLDRGAPFIKTTAGPDGAGSGLRRWFHDATLGGILQHETRDHMDTDFARYLFLAVYGKVNCSSPKLRHFPPLLLPKHRSIRDKEGRARNLKIFHDRFRVQLADKPATTIMSHIRKDGHYFIHYDPWQCRSLTVREAARIQTFPDNYFFEGNRTQQYEQVGNAVPPYLAVHLAEVVADIATRFSEVQAAAAGIPEPKVVAQSR